MLYPAYLSISVCGFVVTFLFVRLFRSLALRWNFLDYPAERKFHRRPMPLMGGAAIFTGFWVSVCAGLFAVKVFPSIIPQDIKIYIEGIWIRVPWLLVIFAGGIIAAGAGLWDDKFVLNPRQKIFFQFIAAFITAAAGIRVRLFLPEPLSYVVSIIWIIAIINAFNLLDNMDGVSSGIALVSCLLLFFASVIMKNYFVSAILAVFIGALAGFLYFNFPPAVIFMGDCGSNFIGYIISVVSILGTYYRQKSPTLFPVVIPLCILAVPIFDVVSVIFIRAISGKSIFSADKNHFSHRLVAMGMNVKTAVIFLYLVTFFAGLPSLLLPVLSLAGVLIVFLQMIGFMSIIAVLEYYGKKR